MTYFDFNLRCANGHLAWAPRPAAWVGRECLRQDDRRVDGLPKVAGVCREPLKHHEQTAA